MQEKHHNSVWCCVAAVGAGSAHMGWFNKQEDKLTAAAAMPEVELKAKKVQKESMDEDFVPVLVSLSL